MMSLSLCHGRPMRMPDVWLRHVRGENAAYSPDTGRVHFLNDTALAILTLCDGETAPEEMIEAICQLCGMHQDVVTEDVERILAEFERACLVSWIR